MPPFATMVSTSVQLQTKLKTTHVVATCFLQLGFFFLQVLTNNVDKYKSRNKIIVKIVCHMLTP
jgi:hypothetical protein